MAVSNMGRQWMVLAGLTSWTFYIPNRILRQLGVRQVLPPVDPENFVLPNFNFATLRAYQNNWRERMIITKEPYPSVLLPGRYKRWLVIDIETRENGNNNWLRLDLSVPEINCGPMTCCMRTNVVLCAFSLKVYAQPCKRSLFWIKWVYENFPLLITY